MHVRASREADAVVKAVNPGDARRLIDVGGGPGTYAVAFLKACAGLQAVIVDLPEVIPLARRYVAGSGVEDRVRFVAADFKSDQLPRGFDLAFVSAIIHMHGPDENLALFRAVYDALVPGGRIVIRDHVMDPDRTRPRSGALFAVNMLVSTAAGTTYTYEEIRSALEEAGFVRVRLIRRAEMSSLVEAFRPEAGP